jgi:uncharacterized lipoprotein YddW (UPF0748 family)
MKSKLFPKIAKALTLIVVAIAGCNKITQAPPHQPQNQQEIQGVWLTHLGTAFYVYTGQLDNVFHQLSRLNFNRVYVSVYNDGVTYPTQVSFRNNLASLPFTNPLKSVLQEGQRQGLKIYAWYEYGLMLNPNDPLSRKHPDWLLEKGKVVDGFVWLNPAHPEVQQYFVKLFTEVAQKYPDLQGIQLDDHWSTPIQFGNRAVALTELTKKISRAVKKVNPNLVISLSPNPPNFAYNRYSQDWLTWVRRGYINEVVVQIYRKNTQEVMATLSHSGMREASQYVPVAAGLFTKSNGNFLRLKPLAEVKLQREAIKRRGYGYSLFTYEYTFSFLRLATTKTKESYFR